MITPGCKLQDTEELLYSMYFCFVCHLLQPPSQPLAFDAELQSNGAVPTRLGGSFVALPAQNVSFLFFLSFQDSFQFQDI